MDATIGTRSLLSKQSRYPGLRPPKTTPSLSHYMNNIFAFRWMFYAFDLFIYFLGPLLIALALCITFGLCYTFFYILVPMMHGLQQPNHVPTQTTIFPIWVHESYVAWVVFNIIFNYFLCVASRKDRAGSEEYEQVAREMAIVCGFHYPETADDRNAWFVEWRRKRLCVPQDPLDPDLQGLGGTTNSNERIPRDGLQPTKRVVLSSPADDDDKDWTPMTSNIPRKLNCTVDDIFNGDAVTQMPSTSQLRSNLSNKRSRPRWMELNPYEWSYCYHSNLPKPPRAHFDHVTQSLVLNMDHYCPWVFNTVGYYNYRYFVNFLIYISIGMIYGTVLSYRSFISMDSALYDEQKKALKEWARTNPVTTFRRIYPFVPLPFERSSIALSFVLCLTVGIAVVIILLFHIYLILTAQTTIEFHGNWVKKAQCKLRKIPFKYPYSLGWKRNLQQVFGSGMVILWFLPSIREPEFLPIPLKGDKGVRERIRLAYFVESNRLEPSKSEDHDSQV